MALRLPPEFGGSLVRGLRGLSGTGEEGLVPRGRLAGPMPWVIAIMVALTVVTAAAGLALSNVARNAADALSGGATIQIVEANPMARLQQAEAAVTLLNRTPGIEAATIISEAEVERLIEPWLSGLSGVRQDIPVPALIDVRMRDPVTAETLGALRRLVRDAAPAARIDAQSTWLSPVFATIDSLRWLSAALVGMLAAALAAVVLLAVRNALGTNRETIEIVHLLGGTDRQIARLFQRSVGFDAAVGGILGLGIGMVLIVLLGRQLAGLGAGLVSGGALGWIDWALIALVPVAGLGLAMITARITVLRALREML